MKYRCLVLDHDDTVVQSTPDIHYPSFVEASKILRPNMKPLTLEEFISYCFNPGFAELCKDIMKFTKEEQEYQQRIWKGHTTTKVPEFYPGFVEFIKEYKSLGGIICVVSHSEIKQIIRDYKLNCDLTPDLIFGWDDEADKRKPSPYPIREIMKRFNLQCNELLVVDDLKPGLDMARSCNVDFAGAGWSHLIPEIKNYMEKESDYYFQTVRSLKEFILSN